MSAGMILAPKPATRKSLDSSALSGDADHLTAEAADLLFHLMILLNEGGVALDDVLAELDRREGVSGLVEKAAREYSGE